MREFKIGDFVARYATNKGDNTTDWEKIAYIGRIVALELGRSRFKLEVLVSIIPGYCEVGANVRPKNSRCKKISAPEATFYSLQSGCVIGS